MATLTETVESRIDKSGGPDACWPWQGCLNRYGYGVLRFEGELHYAHRVMLETVHGPLGLLCALHHCDNRPCCNPRHLFAGTRGDNSRDRAAKGRPGGGGRKLSAAQVAAVRAAPGLHRENAAQFGVSGSLVSLIRSGKHRP